MAASRTAISIGPPLALVALFCAGLFGLGLALDAHWLRLLAKPGPVVALGLWVWRRAPAGAYRRFILFGLGASLAGDLFLELDPRSLFVAGLASFLLAHLFYVAAYVSDARAPSLARAIPAYGYGALALAALWSGLGPMRVPVVLYTAVISTMLWRAAARVGRVSASSGRLALAGAIVFAASDSMIAFGRFGGEWLDPSLRTSLVLRVAIMTTYWLGQWGIAGSACARGAR